MIKRIIFLQDKTPFNQRDFKRLGFELLMKNGFEVENWDLTNILEPYVARNYTPPDPINWAGCKIFDDKKKALDRLKNLNSDTFIIPLFPYSRTSYPFYRAISACNVRYGSFMVNILPSLEDTRKSDRFLAKLKRLRKLSWKKLIDYSFRKCPSRWLGIKPAELIFAAGNAPFKYIVPVDNSTEILWAHALDYDLYLEERNKPFCEQPMAVFLDQDKIFHPHYNIQYCISIGKTPPISADKYYALLNKFFRLIEDQLGLEVVIAAHPRSKYENHPDYFEGRKCLRGRTVRLVKESKLVLAHDSIAVSFANLFYKSVIFLTSSEFNERRIYNMIEVMAKSFGKKPIFIDKDSIVDWRKELMVSKSCYENYRQTYIKTDNSPDLPFWQIVADRLKEGF